MTRPATQGGYVLDSWGALHPFAAGAGAIPPPVTSGPYWPGSDTAKAAVLDPDGSGGYVLDSWGGIHPFAVDGAPLPPAPGRLTYYVANGAAVDFVVTDWSEPSGFTLDAAGSRHPFGPAQIAEAAGPSPPASAAATEGEVLRGCRTDGQRLTCTYATPYGGYVER